MLAVLHGDEADFGADGGLAGRIDDDIDLVIGAHRLRILVMAVCRLPAPPSSAVAFDTSRAVPGIRPAISSACLAASMLISAMAARDARHLVAWVTMSVPISPDPIRPMRIGLPVRALPASRDRGRGPSTQHWKPSADIPPIVQACSIASTGIEHLYFCQD